MRHRLDQINSEPIEMLIVPIQVDDHTPLYDGVRAYQHEAGTATVDEEAVRPILPVDPGFLMNVNVASDQSFGPGPMFQQYSDVEPYELTYAVDRAECRPASCSRRTRTPADTPGTRVIRRPAGRTPRSL